MSVSDDQNHSCGHLSVVLGRYCILMYFKCISKPLYFSKIHFFNEKEKCRQFSSLLGAALPMGTRNSPGCLHLPSNQSMSFSSYSIPDWPWTPASSNLWMRGPNQSSGKFLIVPSDLLFSFCRKVTSLCFQPKILLHHSSPCSLGRFPHIFPTYILKLHSEISHPLVPSL